MPFAGGISLIAVGAILAFALTGSIRGIDLGTVGLILMLAGAVAILIPILLSRRPGRRRPPADTDRPDTSAHEPGHTESLPRYDPSPREERRLPEESRPSWKRPGRN